MSILFNRCVSLQVDPIFVNIRKINSSPLNGVHFIHPKLFLFFPPSHPFFFKDSDFLIEYPFYWWEVSPFFSINVLTRWFSRRCSTSSSFLIPFSSPVDSSQVLLIIFFPHFNVFSYRCTSLSFYFSLFVILECSRYLEDSCFHSAFVQALSRLVSHSSHLIQPVQHLF